MEQPIEEDPAEGKNGGRIQNTFPELNGYLYRPCKGDGMDFGAAEKYNGVCNLRFDDLNRKENNEYVENILNDIKWLGFKWGNIFFTSDYFQSYGIFAIWMIKQGNAYVDNRHQNKLLNKRNSLLNLAKQVLIRTGQ